MHFGTFNYTYLPPLRFFLTILYSYTVDDLKKANRRAIKLTNSSDIETAESEVEKRKRHERHRKRNSSDSYDTETFSPVKSRKEFRLPMVKPLKISSNIKSKEN